MIHRPLPPKNPACPECQDNAFYSQPEWAADGVTPCHRIGTAAIKCPVVQPVSANGTRRAE
jgi:hypothetical protein